LSSRKSAPEKPLPEVGLDRLRLARVDLRAVLGLDRGHGRLDVADADPLEHRGDELLRSRDHVVVGLQAKGQLAQADVAHEREVFHPPLERGREANRLRCVGQLAAGLILERVEPPHRGLVFAPRSDVGDQMTDIGSLRANHPGDEDLDRVALDVRRREVLARDRVRVGGEVDALAQDALVEAVFVGLAQRALVPMAWKRLAEDRDARGAQHLHPHRRAAALGAGDQDHWHARFNACSSVSQPVLV
jgi:hypothetical protein